MVHLKCKHLIFSHLGGFYFIRNFDIPHQEEGLGSSPSLPLPFSVLYPWTQRYCCPMTSFIMSQFRTQPPVPQGRVEECFSAFLYFLLQQSHKQPKHEPVSSTEWSLELHNSNAQIKLLTSNTHAIPTSWHQETLQRLQIECRWIKLFITEITLLKDTEVRRLVKVNAHRQI